MPAAHAAPNTAAISHSHFDFSRTPARSAAHAATLHRHAAGAAPAAAPQIVHEVLRSQGRALPADARRDVEARLGHNFADVRVHSDARAGASAQAVAAHAYTVGRQIVFAPGRFEPATAQGRRLLTHELSHASAHPAGAPTPSGELRISSPSDAAERHATGVAEGSATPAAAPATAPGLFREADALIGLDGVSVNHDRVTVAPSPGLAFTAIKSPAGAQGVTLSVVGDNASVAAGTTVNQASGAITVAATQTGGSAHVAATQNATAADGSTLTSSSPATAPFNFTAIASGIRGTTASRAGTAGLYGGEFTHTFTSPGGGQAALARSRVNERFAAASGTALAITGKLGTLAITVNDPDAATGGWDLDASGTMTGPDHVTWGDVFSARPFVANASQPTPADVLPQELTAVQDFRNLTFPGQTYGATAVASTTHRRAFEQRGDRIKAITSAGIAQEIVEDYVGPTVFRRCRAAPASIPVAAPAPPGGTAPAATTATVSVDAEGKTATPMYSVRAPELGCTISSAGVLTPGTTPGTVTVRAGDSVNFDETSVILTPPPATAPPAPTPSPP